MNKTNYVALTVQPNYMDQSFKEILEFDSHAKVTRQFPNGIMLVRPSLEQAEFMQLLGEKKPVFVRHASAFDYAIDFEGYEDLCGKVSQIVLGYGDKICEKEEVAVQVRKLSGDYDFEFTDIKEKMDVIIEKELHGVATIKEPTKIISILLYCNTCYIGCANAKENLSSWTGGMVHYKKDEKLDVSRAKYKLMEAIYDFNIDLYSVKNAIDLGAAPGGWTSILIEYGIDTTAVDTGEMDKRLMKNPLVNYVHGNVAEVDLGERSVQMLTSDISWNPVNTAKMVKKIAEKHLQSGGIAIVTVKLMGDKIWRTIKDVEKVYEDTFEIRRKKQLFHNRDEITLYMIKK